MANPHFTPELSAKASPVNFTVTRDGLESQLLGFVVRMERQELEDQRQRLLEELNSNSALIAQLQDDLLSRLSNSEGNLLDDDTLVKMLNKILKAQRTNVMLIRNISNSA